MSPGLVPDEPKHPIIPEEYWKMAWDRFCGIEPTDKSDPSMLAGCFASCETPPVFVLRGLSELLSAQSQKQPHLKLIKPPRYSKNSAIAERHSMMALKALYNAVAASPDMPVGHGSQKWAIQEVIRLFEKEKYPPPNYKTINAAVRYDDSDFTKKLFCSLFENVPWPPPANQTSQDYISELTRPENAKRPSYGKVSEYAEHAHNLMEKYFP